MLIIYPLGGSHRNTQLSKLKNVHFNYISTKKVVKKNHYLNLESG